MDMGVRVRRGERFACNPFLNLMEGCKRYGRFMLSRTQRNVPRLTFHIARINRVSHDAVGLFIRQVPVPRDRESGVRLEEAFNFRSEEHTSELQSIMRISYADFCLK